VPSAALRRLAVGYFVAQGLGVLAWWVLLFSVPDTRRLFTAAGAPDSVLLAFVLGDVVLVGLGSIGVAAGISRRAEWAWPLLLVHAGAAMFGGAYCVILPLVAAGSGLLAAVAMIPVLIVPVAFAVLLRPRSTES